MATDDRERDVPPEVAARYRIHVPRAVRPRLTAEKEWECRYCGLRWFLAPAGPLGGTVRYTDDGKSIVNLGARRGDGRMDRLPPCPRVPLGTVEIEPLKRDE